jgi:hypothetical protein
MFYIPLISSVTILEVYTVSFCIIFETSKPRKIKMSTVSHNEIILVDNPIFKLLRKRQCVANNFFLHLLATRYTYSALSGSDYAGRISNSISFSSWLTPVPPCYLHVDGSMADAA